MAALPFVRAIAAAIAVLVFIPNIQAAEAVRVGVLKFGTVNWELDSIKQHRLDEVEGIDVEVVLFAGEDATNVALQAGEVDVIVSDWLWVSRQRSAGQDLTFVPFSSSVGAIMVPDASPIRTLADLKNRKIGVAGGPLDKGWLLIQGLAKRDFGIDLAKAARPVYGAAPLLAEKAVQGELDAVLNFWHYCAKLEARGFRRLIGADEAAIALGATGRIAAIGYVFHEKWANAHPAAAIGFVKASRAAKQILAGSDAEWQRLDAIIKSDDAAHLNALMTRFREGIPSRPTAEEEADAARLYGILAELGGERLVGASMTMSHGTYWATLKHGF
ncbi:MAG: ABC transporter substrate-binding protein [Hyphomicrobiales bacterium]|nr:ABC transporter substrate-binding protein [Hyphomicrobiales bacterium]